MITLNLNPDHSVTWSDGPIQQPSPQPVVPPTTQPSPPPAAGANYFDWAASGFLAQQVVPGYGNPVVGPGDTGGCVRFIADSIKYPFGVLFGFFNTTEPINPQDFCISVNPNDFTNIVPGSLLQGMGNSSGLGVRFGNQYPTQGAGDCQLVAGQTYYINFREYAQPRGTAHAVFNFTVRTS